VGDAKSEEGVGVRFWDWVRLGEEGRGGVGLSQPVVDFARTKPISSFCTNEAIRVRGGSAAAASTVSMSRGRKRSDGCSPQVAHSKETNSARFL
jgi:hypothetical protein